MRHSDDLTALLPALMAARLAFPPITRNCEAWSPKSKKTYPYADLNAIIDATVPILGAHGVLVMQAPEDGEPGLMCVTTTLFHVTSGQWMRSTLSFERLSNPQDAGSQITYYKRYGLAGILSLSTETDDDASSLNGSSKPEPAAAAEHPRPSVPVNGNGHTPAQEQPKGTPKNLVQKSDLLHQIQDEITRLGRPVGEVTALYQAAFGEEIASWDLVCGESLHTLKHGLQYLRTLRPEVAPDGPVFGSTEVATSPAPQPSVAEGTATDTESSTLEPEPEDTVESLVAYAVGTLGLEEPTVRRVIKLHRDLTKCKKIFIEASARNRQRVA